MEFGYEQIRTNSEGEEEEEEVIHTMAFDHKNVRERGLAGNLIPP